MITERDDHDLGYADKTLGWSGSSTSRERAEDELDSGLASARLSVALDLVSRAGPYGLTWGELAGLTDWHHGQATASLSNLHKNGDLARLHDRRGRSKIYVAPEYVQGRLTERHGRSRPPQAVRADLSPSELSCLVLARDRARELYREPGSRVALWSDRASYERFWRVITKVIDEG